MGLLRLLLALIVCYDHYAAAKGYPLRPMGITADQSVEVFFLISGFYMALILTTSYVGPENRMRFYRNRILRLYPTYLFLVLVHTVGAIIIAMINGKFTIFSEKVAALSAADPFTFLYIILSNVFIFGVNESFFFSWCPDLGTLCTFDPAALPGYILTVIAPAWSIEVELIFYLFAPFLITVRSVYLWPIALLTIAIKLWMRFSPQLLDNTAWLYHFPPLEIGLFILGILAYRTYAKRGGTVTVTLGVKALCVVCFAFLIAAPRGIFDDFYRAVAMYPIAFLAVPWLFFITKSNKLDRNIGELSYPLYLSHTMVLRFVQHIISSKYSPIIAIVLSLVISWLIYRYIARPIDNWRHTK